MLASAAPFSSELEQLLVPATDPKLTGAADADELTHAAAAGATRVAGTLVDTASGLGDKVDEVEGSALAVATGATRAFSETPCDVAP